MNSRIWLRTVDDYDIVLRIVNFSPSVVKIPKNIIIIIISCVFFSRVSSRDSAASLILSSN